MIELPNEVVESRSAEAETRGFDRMSRCRHHVVRQRPLESPRNVSSCVTREETNTCPGCGAELPADPDAQYGGKFHAVPECWRVFCDVLAREFGNAILFGAVHQMTVDAYAVQHAGGRHPDKSVAIHLAGLHLMLERGIQPTIATRMLQELARHVNTWPHFEPPSERVSLTIADVAAAADAGEHIARVGAWARTVYD